MSPSNPLPPRAHQPHSEAFWLALVIAVIHALVLAVLVIIAWRSPFVLFRLPPAKEKPAQVAIDPSRPVP